MTQTPRSRAARSSHLLRRGGRGQRLHGAVLPQRGAAGGDDMPHFAGQRLAVGQPARFEGFVQQHRHPGAAAPDQGPGMAGDVHVSIPGEQGPVAPAGPVDPWGPIAPAGPGVPIAVATSTISSDP